MFIYKKNIFIYIYKKMRHLSFDTIKYIFDKYPKYKNINIFIETGTYKGGTIIPMSKYFKELYTIDICENAYKFTSKLAKKNGIKNINFYLGDSATELTTIINKIDKNNNCVFFLDGHVTDNNSGYTGKGIFDVPLLEELKQINEKRNNNDIIIIDDYRIFGKNKSKETANADWQDISIDAILKCLDKEKINTYFMDPNYDNKKQINDRLIILINKL